MHFEAFWKGFLDRVSMTLLGFVLRQLFTEHKVSVRTDGFVAFSTRIERYAMVVRDALGFPDFVLLRIVDDRVDKGCNPAKKLRGSQYP